MKMQAYRTCTVGGATSLTGLPKRRYTNLSVCSYETWNLLWKRILPGSFSGNTPIVNSIVNSEQRPASGLVSTPLPGNNQSGFRVDRIFPSVWSMLPHLLHLLCLLHHLPSYLPTFFPLFTVTWDEKTHSGISPHIIVQYVHFLVPVSFWY